MVYIEENMQKLVSIPGKYTHPANRTTGNDTFIWTNTGL